MITMNSVMSSSPATSRSASTSSTENSHLVVQGFKLPDSGPLTHNEHLWIENLRTIVGDTDPRPTLRTVQALRVALMAR